MMGYLITAYILNIVDYIFTAHWVRKFGIEIEANPFGRWMFSHNIAWVVKIFIMGGLFALLGYFIKQYNKGEIVAKILLVVFILLTLYHIAIAIRVAVIGR